MKNIKEFIYQGGKTDDILIDRVACVRLVINYLEIKCRYNHHYNGDTMLITDANNQHVITLYWSDYGFSHLEDFEELTARSLEIILVATSIIFQSLFTDLELITLDDSRDKLKQNEEWWI